MKSKTNGTCIATSSKTVVSGAMQTLTGKDKMFEDSLNY